MARNVHKEEIELIKLPSVAESEKRGRELCGVPFPVLADTADSRYWKNDRTGLAFKLDSITVELEALDGTLYAAPGLPIAFPHQSDAVGFVIDWRQLVDGGVLRAGCYKVKVSWTKSSLSGSFYYGSYDLKNYSTDTSEGTARLFVVLNDFVRSEGINYKDSGFATTFRFEGRFGDMQPNYETTNNVLTNRIQEKVRNQANRTYTLKTQFLRSCFTHKIDHEHLLAANRIYISDYNAFNHKQYKDFPVILDEEQSPEYNYPGGSILASVTAYFKDKQLLSESKYDGNIQGSDNIILELPTGASGCADGFAQNSDATFSLTVPSGTTQPIPDSQLNVNSVSQGNVVSVKTIDVNVTDGVNPVTINSVSLVGNTLTIEVTPQSVGNTLMKTGQTTSYRTGDDGDIQAGRDTDFLTLPFNNPFGNTNRFTDELGGSTYTNQIAIDWSTYNGVNVLGYSLDDGGIDLTWNDSIDWALAYSVGAYTSGWRLINRTELNNILNIEESFIMIYSPFNYKAANYWTGSTRKNLSDRAFAIVSGQGTITSIPKTFTYRPIAVRTFTVTGTTLT